MFSYFIWDINPEIFSTASFSLRWQAIFLILAFVTSRQLLFYIYSKEGRTSKEAGQLITIVLISALLGARIVHVILYESILFLSDPLEIFFPFEFQPDFIFTAKDGFSLHGSAIGVIIGVWFYSRRKSLSQQFLPLLDKTTILAALSGTLLFTGSALNSEIIGTPTNSKAGTIFISRVTKGLTKVPCCIMRNPGGNNPVLSTTVKKDNAQIPETREGFQRILMYLFFDSGANEKMVNEFLIGDVKAYLFDMDHIVHEPGTEPLHFTIFIERDGNFIARLKTIGIARHPVQIYEAITCIILFFILFWRWHKLKTDLKPGQILSFFMIGFWLAYFLYGYIKVDQTVLVAGLSLSVEQILSLLLASAGIFTLAFRHKGLVFQKS